MAKGVSKATLLASVFTPALFGVVTLATTSAALAAPCTGPGAPATTQTKCLTAVQIPGKPLRSFDISWVNPDRAEYYLGDRSNAGIDIIDTKHSTFVRTIPGFVGAVLNSAGTAVNNNVSGPDGVTSHGRWLYAGDGNSTLKVIDLDKPTASAIQQSIPTCPSKVPAINSTCAVPTLTRVDEMALTPDGKLLLAANNAADPPFGTLFAANGDNHSSNVSIITQIQVDPSIIPAGAGLSFEQPTWEPKTQRFYVSVPIIANNPTGCNYGQLAGAITCSGGMIVIDPTTLTAPLTVIGAFNATTNTGVVPLNACSPNGITVGPHENLLEGCTPMNSPSDTTTLVINAKTKNYANIGGITGSDEVWFNAGDRRYYTGSSAAIGGAVLGVINATSLLVETIPQSSSSHSVAADSDRNHIFVPQVAPASVVGAGGDKTTVGQGICGGTNGCIAVYAHDVDEDGFDDFGEHHEGFGELHQGFGFLER
ncbi:MAG TPA: hypothetical protein VN832_10885 [Stellaceae bacterium]|nr:hypothetical protein [Stellaceae bacterium]